MKHTQYRSVRHWFSYHWGWILGAVLLLAILLFVFRPSSETEPDYRLSWVGTTALSQSEETAIIRAVSQAGFDQNGDGQITVSVTQFVIDFHMTAGDSRYEENYGHMVKMLAQLQTNACYLYLLEEPERFQYATGALQYLDGSHASEDNHYESEQWEQMCVRWEPDGLEHTAYLARRAFFGEENPTALFPGGDALFSALTNSEGGMTCD